VKFVTDIDHKRTYTDIVHLQLFARCSYLLYSAPACFGRTFWPYSGGLQVESACTAYTAVCNR
jgi:hypothetical protein